MPRYFIIKHPHPTQLSTRRWVEDGAPDPAAPWEASTPEDHAAWEAAQIDAGWVPVPEPAPLATVPAAASRESVLIELAIATASESLPGGLTEEHIDAYIATLADPLERTKARLEAQRPTWRRAHPMIGQIGGALTPPITSEQINEVFRKAALRDAAPL